LDYFILYIIIKEKWNKLYDNAPVCTVTKITYPLPDSKADSDTQFNCGQKCIKFNEALILLMSLDSNCYIP